MPKLQPVTQRFILHWGEMGTRWGVNRTVAQIHALLYLSDKPLTADEIVEALGVARSNVSTSLRELQGWGIVRVVHVMGDRRDHFESMKDVWEMFQVILEQRKRREVDPTLDLLRSCVEELHGSAPASAYTKQRLIDMKDFFETMADCYQEMRKVPVGALRGFVSLKGRLRRLLAG
jgi:DNA-binding transcriptional regulator GbsR (MarR family)